MDALSRALLDYSQHAAEKCIAAEKAKAPIEAGPMQLAEVAARIQKFLARLEGTLKELLLVNWHVVLEPALPYRPNLQEKPYTEEEIAEIKKQWPQKILARLFEEIKTGHLDPFADEWKNKLPNEKPGEMPSLAQ